MSRTRLTLAVLIGVVTLSGIVALSIRLGAESEGLEIYSEEVSQRAIVRVVKASGQIDPRVKVNLSSQVIGKIERLYVAEGDSVTAGQLVLELEKDQFLAARDRASAALRIAQSRRKQAEIDIEDAAVKLKRMQRLFSEQIASQADLETVELAHLSKELALEQAHESVVQAVAALEEADDQLAKCTLYAPLSGRVIALDSEEGESVIPGTMNVQGSVIGTIADLSEILAEVEVDETEIPYLELDQPAAVKVDALPEVEYDGRVVEIGSSGFDNPRQPEVTFFRVKILLERPDSALRPGMSLRAEISTAEKPDALAVPIQSVVERLPAAEDDAADGDEEEIEVVFVVEDGEARQRPVRTGLSDTTHVEIVEGVSDGARVVTGPYRSLRDLEDGEKIQLKEEGETEDEESS